MEGDRGIPAVFGPESQDLTYPHSTPLTLRADAELRALLQALPTRANMESLANRLETSHRQDIAAVRSDITMLTERMGAGVAKVSVQEWRLQRVEEAQAAQVTSILSQQLRLEEMEDRSRRNNLRLRGMPEATGTEDLVATALAIFRNVAGDTLPQNVSFYRIHRALGPRPADPNHPRDVICRIHQYTHKEVILRKAWEMRDTEFDGATIRILPDLSRATLQRRAMLKPVL